MPPVPSSAFWELRRPSVASICAQGRYADVLKAWPSQDSALPIVYSAKYNITFFGIEKVGFSVPSVEYVAERAVHRSYWRRGWPTAWGWAYACVDCMQHWCLGMFEQAYHMLPLLYHATSPPPIFLFIEQALFCPRSCTLLTAQSSARSCVRCRRAVW